MGIYINMEMPKNGCHHIICIYANGTVSAGRKEYRAVPVPPHGRLIDADALIETCRTMARQCDDIGVSIWAQFATMVELRPTIVREEEDER